MYSGLYQCMEKMKDKRELFQVIYRCLSGSIQKRYAESVFIISKLIIKQGELKVKLSTYHIQVEFCSIIIQDMLRSLRGLEF